MLFVKALQVFDDKDGYLGALQQKAHYPDQLVMLDSALRARYPALAEQAHDAYGWRTVLETAEAINLFQGREDHKHAL